MDKYNETETISPKPLPQRNNYLRAHVVKIVSEAFNRTPDWVYKVIGGRIEGKNTAGVKEFYEQEFQKLSEKINL